MKKILLASVCLLVSSTPVLAGGLPGTDNTAVGTGVAKSTSVSSSQATAISGQGGTGVGVGVGQGGKSISSSTTIFAAQPSSTSQTITTQGHSSVSTVPSVFAPGLSSAGIESCLGSVSGGVSWLGTGITGGGSIPDKGCDARLSARTLWAFGLKKAAIARLCLDEGILASMPDVCAQYLPRPAYAPIYAPVAPVGYYAEGQPYTGGQIMLVEGRTGKERLCNNYDQAHTRCRVWADGVNSTPRKVTRTVSREVKTAAVASPVVSEKKVEEPHPVSTLMTSTQTPLWLQMVNTRAGSIKEYDKHEENPPRVGSDALSGERR